MKELEKFITVQGYECLNASFVNFLNYKGLSITGGEICFLGGGFLIQRKEGIGVVSNLYNSYFNALNYFGVKYQQKKELNKEPLEFIKIHIDQGEMLCVNVNAKYLGYHTIFQQAETDSPHFINVIGYDEQKQSIKISDGFVPTLIPSLYQGWIPILSFMRGWNDKKFEHFCLKKEEKKIDWNEVQLIKLQNLIHSTYRYLDSSKMSLDHEVYGENAIIKSFQYLLEKTTNVKEEIFKFNYQLRINGFFSIKRFTLQALESLQLEPDLCLSYQNIINEWNNFSLLLIKAGISGKFLTLNKVISKGRKMIEDEREVLCSILSRMEQDGQLK